MTYGEDRHLEMVYEEQQAPTLLDDGPDYHADDWVDRCLSCGDPVDYCLCHGPTLQGFWDAHDSGDHSRCHPNACDEVESLQ